MMEDLVVRGVLEAAAACTSITTIFGLRVEAPGSCRVRCVLPQAVGERVLHTQCAPQEYVREFGRSTSPTSGGVSMDSSSASYAPMMIRMSHESRPSSARRRSHERRYRYQIGLFTYMRIISIFVKVSSENTPGRPCAGLSVCMRHEGTHGPLKMCFGAP